MVRSADLTLIIILATTTMAISKITEPSGTVLLLFILFSISRAKKLAGFPPPAVECPIYQWGIHHLAGQGRTRRTDRSQGCLCKQWIDSFLAKKRGLFQLLNRKKKGQKYENWAILKVSSVGWKKMSKGAQKEARIRSSAPLDCFLFYQSLRDLSRFCFSAEDLPAKTRVFNDTTPFNGTEVEEEVFKKEEFKLC